MFRVGMVHSKYSRMSRFARNPAQCYKKRIQGQLIQRLCWSEQVAKNIQYTPCHRHVDSK